MNKKFAENPVDRFAERISARADRLSPSMQSVAEYIRDNLSATLSQSALEIAHITDTSDATVIRTVQALGFSGLRDLKDTIEGFFIATNSPTAKMASTTSDVASDVDTAIDFMVEDQLNAMRELAKPHNRSGMQNAVTLLSKANRIGVSGIGASGIIASYAARLFSRSGYPAYELTRTGISLAEQLIQMGEGDVIVMLGHGRLHREASATVAEAERLSVPLVGIVTSDKSPLIKIAQASIVLPRSKSDQVALHAPMMCCLETMMLGLASANPTKPLETLERIVEIRNRIRPRK
ncbi:MAG: MurR/RpiR family transcriptional regulator [Rhodospirillales bacterium]|nr:MurR/RpiR family transcriptional regulator [Rhodospirillales bacterium]